MADFNVPDWGFLFTLLQQEIAELATGVFESADGTITLSQSDFGSPSELSQRNSSEQLSSFFFCLRYNGKPMTTQMVVAQSPDLAALTMQQLVSLLNEWAPRRGFPSLFDAIAGSCPAVR